MEVKISKLLNSRYKMTVTGVKRTVGYEDFNFIVEICSSDIHDFGQNESRCVMKITSTSKDYLDIQFQMMSFLYDNGFPTCRPIPDIDGNFLVPFDDKLTAEESETSRAAYVLSYVPGITLLEAKNPLTLLEELGKLTGRMDKALMNFKPTCSLQREFEWGMTKIPDLESKLRQFCSQDEVQLGLDIIQSFKVKVIRVLDKLQQGYIHGDINNCNIIVQSNKGNDYVISGIIDYGDACKSFYVYELVTVMADLISSCLGQHEPLEVASLLFKGYTSEMTLITEELDILKLLLCARLLQVYVLSGESMFNDRGNEYVAIERRENIEVCRYIWTMEDEYFNKIVLENTALEKRKSKK